MDRTRRIRVLGTIALLGLMANSTGWGDTTNKPPVAEAGLPRYAAKDPVLLDGTGSYDPDHSGPLSYAWRQVSGPPLVIADANTATPTISGFVQTELVQECEFELVVSDGELTSPPGTVKVFIVPDFGPTTLQQENPPFDPAKPTVIYFGGGDCWNGEAGDTWEHWYGLANIISFPQGYVPDSRVYESWVPTYYHLGDMIIVFLSKVAPQYQQPIQTIGWSAGGLPALDAGIRLNRAYKDARYAVNHVTELETPCRWLNPQQGMSVYASSNALFLTSAVDGEQCWHDHCWGDTCPMEGNAPRDLLCVWLEGYGHEGVLHWYMNSLSTEPANEFNHGLVAGAYWSVVGPGKNLQLAAQGGGYYFSLTDANTQGHMVFYDESQYPGRLPEPVTLIGPGHGAVVDPNGAVLTCRASENAVGYQLLFGADPYHMVYLLSDTSSPPSEPVASFPFEHTWWTVRAYDRYGSTIYADRLLLHAESVRPQSIQNSGTRQTYASIQQAINYAHEGDEIVLGAGVCQYLENLDFKGKSLTLRSVDPNDPRVVASTIIAADGRTPGVTLSSGKTGHPLIEGLTLTGGTVGISCRDAVPTIRNCTIRSSGPVAIEFWYGYEPRVLDCNVVGQVIERIDPSLVAHWKLDEAEGITAYDSAGTNNALLIGNPLWQPDAGKVGGALQFDGIDDYVKTPFVLNPAVGALSVFAWIRGGVPGRAVVSQMSRGANWLSTDPTAGWLMTELKAQGGLGVPLRSQTVITDGAWHRAGLVWDGRNRILYVDGVEIARDTQPSLASSPGGLYIGAGTKVSGAVSFWSGLIDDVRIYNRAVKP